MNHLHISDLDHSPEDAVIGRDLVDCHEILDLMKYAYEAGKSGEPFEVTYTDK